MRADRAQMRAVAWLATRAAVESQVSLADAALRVIDAGPCRHAPAMRASRRSVSTLGTPRAVARV